MKFWSIYLAPEGRTESMNVWHPPVDIYRKGGGWLLKFDLAGVRSEDVRLWVSGSRITVTGVRRDWVVEQGYSHHSMEICYNRFERTIDLPGDLSGAEYSLDARDGLLLVRVEPAQPRTGEPPRSIEKEDWPEDPSATRMVSEEGSEDQEG